MKSWVIKFIVFTVVVGTTTTASHTADNSRVPTVAHAVSGSGVAAVGCVIDYLPVDVISL